MPDRSFGRWLLESKVKVMALVLTIAVVTFLLILGFGGSFHTSEMLDRHSVQLEKVVEEATRARIEAQEGRREAQESRKAIRELQQFVRETPR